MRSSRLCVRSGETAAEVGPYGCTCASVARELLLQQWASWVINFPYLPEKFSCLCERLVGSLFRRIGPSIARRILAAQATDHQGCGEPDRDEPGGGRDFASARIE